MNVHEAIRVIAWKIDDYRDRRELCRIVSRGADAISMGPRGQFRRTPAEVAHDLYGEDVALDLFGGES